MDFRMGRLCGLKEGVPASLHRTNSWGDAWQTGFMSFVSAWGLFCVRKTGSKGLQLGFGSKLSVFVLGQP